ncbi:N-acetylglucosamine-6-phosphate deacetylase [Oceanobacillus luteolus]|uniref:N-acetylglucosamine-6-phosphate deacetylase n=1 Tax=Oceanobacillus luteolus TaxID=1274358 RepID=A0ABW4HKZ5_9BACI|nr:N-acetylglucosamine-6-phosphate deacetylase [Oceanobacillus luteolus]MCM3740643.1 N-acetylglucosamine-6-phosphate deacetylase [Oceanobacillus luteolus]
MKKSALLIKNATIYLENQVLNRANLYVENGQIKEIIDEGELSSEMLNEAHIIDAENLNVIPGFIDSHIHGANGADVMDSTHEALQTMAQFLPKEGTTAFLATTITQSPDNIEQALTNIVSYENTPGQAEVAGVHLEGPFVEKSKAGAQPKEFIMQPDLQLFNEWQRLSGNNIRTITLAPEHDTDGSFIQALNESGVIVSAGHTDVGFHEMKQAVRHGVRQLTHLCNAMNGIHHRDVGAVGAGFLLKELSAELIADGIHVTKEMLQIIYNQMGSDRLILITDAMRAKGLEPGDYELGGQPVEVTEDRAVLEDGTLAGSILTMDAAAKLMLELDGVGWHDIIRMASVNPAKQVGMFDRKGSIAKGKDADLVIVDDGFNIKFTICRGVIAYEG